MEALAHTEEFSIPRMEAALGLHHMKANANVVLFFFCWKPSVQTGKIAFWSCCCLPVTLAVPVLQTRLRAPIELYKLCVVTTRLAPPTRPLHHCWSRMFRSTLTVLVGGLSLSMQVLFAAVAPLQQLHPLSFGEGISLDPLPPKEIRWVGPGCDSVCVSAEKFAWWSSWTVEFVLVKKSCKSNKSASYYF